jgi:hypothetical protein
MVDAGGPGSLVFGELDGSIDERGRRLLALCEAAGIPAELVDDIRARLWEKFALICAQAGMTGGTRLALGPIRDTPEAWTMFRAIVEEVVALASAEGVDLRRGPVLAVSAAVPFQVVSGPNRLAGTEIGDGPAVVPRYGPGVRGHGRRLEASTCTPGPEPTTRTRRR